MSANQESGQTALAQALVESSIVFAQSAASAYSSESWHLYYLHLATAVEHLVKSVLAGINPAFIADSRAGFDSLLHLCGMADKAATPDFAGVVKTITIKEALSRVGRFIPQYRQPTPAVRLLLDLRNSVVHVGHCEKRDAETMLADTAEYVAQLLSFQGVAHDQYWGASAVMVSEHTTKRLSEIEALCSRHIQAAKDRYARTIESMDSSGHRAFLATTMPVAPRPSFDSALVDCPACGNPGELTGFPEPDWEADVDVEGGEAYVCGTYVASIHLQADGFHCYACGLDLGPQELPFAGMGDVVLIPDDFDVSDATRYFERRLADEEYWSDY